MSVVRFSAHYVPQATTSTTVVGVSLEGRWDVAGPVATTLDGRWDVLVPTVQLLQALWDITAPAGSALNSRWDMQQIVGATLDGRWDVAVTSATTETVHANAVVLNNLCETPENAHGAPDAVWTTNTGSTNWDCRWSLTNPTNLLAAGETHTVSVKVRREATGGNTPTIALELWQSGTLVKTLFAATNVEDTTTDLSGAFTTAEVSGSTGLEVRDRGRLRRTAGVA